MGFEPQQGTSLIAYDPEKNAFIRKPLEQFDPTGQRGQPFEVDRAEPVEIDVARLRPALLENLGKGLAQAQSDAIAGFLNCPQWLTHCRHQKVKRLVDRGPAVD